MSAAAILSRPFEQLREGDVFESGAREIAAADIDSFASLTGDRHPVHVDADWATSSPFGERIAPGALTLSYALGLLRFDPEHALALVGISNVVFTRPVKIGDTISIEGRIAALTAGTPESGTVTLAILTRNQHGQIVCRARVEFKWKRAGNGSSEDDTHE